MALTGLPPLNPSEFLKWVETDWPRLYILGSFNRQITVHSQQCRAINLIQALISEGGGIEGKQVGIVGAGFAGLTAAAYALEKTTAEVTLFDAAPRALWLQDACSNRWLHPGIYDWPLPGSLEPCTNLPVLNWRAGTARDVVRQVRAEWDRIATTKGALKLSLETRVESVRPDGDRLAVVLSGGMEQFFDIVVLAVGFGVEEGGPKHVGYWSDSDGLDGIAKGAKVLISGFGDGGLADVLRLCLPDVRQAHLVELVRSVPDDVCRALIEKENALQKNIAGLDEFYRQMAPVDEIVKRLKNSAPPHVLVTLTGKTQYVYGTGSAILNRFLVSHLRYARNDSEFRLRKEIVDGSITELPDGRTRVTFADGQTDEFDHVIYRWGPQPAYQRIGLLKDWKIAGERRRHWREMPQSLDDTRVLLDGSGHGDLAGSKLTSKLLANESSSRKWCLILRSEGAKTEWEVHMRLAMRACQTLAHLNIEPVEITSKDILSDELPIQSLVRALCAADILLADVTGYDPAIVLLLGIRAAVRRGITIACTSEGSAQEIWEDLPFNLRELNIVFGENKGALLEKTLSAALAQSNSSRYLDLPVYDYIRQEPPEQAPPDEAPPDVERVLLLRPFKKYDEARLEVVSTGIRDGFRLEKNARVESVIDQRSPRLAGQRLYEAIRHWRRCVVDLTWWRANVLFELGVRLATHPEETYCLLDEKADQAGEVHGSKELKRFLAPFPYDLKPYGFAAVFKGEAAGLSTVYDAAAQHFRAGQDSYDELVDAGLTAAADATQRRNAQQEVDIVPLYGSKNAAFGNVILSSALEKRCAAWCYLAERERPHLLRPIDLLDERHADCFRRFGRLSSRLKLDLARGSRDVHMRERIAEAELAAVKSRVKEMADLLDVWTRIRKVPPWLFKDSDVSAKDCEDWEDDAGQLETLEKLLAGLNNPASDLAMQGVRLDRARVQRSVERFQKGVK